MAQLYFNYSTMNSGKSLELVKTAHNYESQGKEVLVFTSDKDTRYGNGSKDQTKGQVTTRLGLSKEAFLIERVDCFAMASVSRPDCVLVDEAQFLEEKHVIELTRIVDQLNIPVICYGLKNDFQNQLFEGSKALLVYADKIQEIKTVCWHCNKKATMNMRLVNGSPSFHGNQIQMGGNLGDQALSVPEVSYIPVCRRCYNEAKALSIII